MRNACERKNGDGSDDKGSCRVCGQGAVALPGASCRVVSRRMQSGCIRNAHLTFQGCIRIVMAGVVVGDASGTSPVGLVGVTWRGVRRAAIADTCTRRQGTAAVTIEDSSRSLAGVEIGVDGHSIGPPAWTDIALAAGGREAGPRRRDSPTGGVSGLATSRRSAYSTPAPAWVRSGRNAGHRPEAGPVAERVPVCRTPPQVGGERGDTTEPARHAGDSRRYGRTFRSTVP